MTTTVNAYFQHTQNKEIYNNYKLQWMLVSMYTSTSQKYGEKIENPGADCATY